MRLLTFIVCILGSTYQYYCQDIYFPDDDDSDTYVSGSTPVVTRKPIKIPDRCPTNMLLYPGEGFKSSWICDCKSRYVYFPENDSCYKVFSRGPCLNHHYVYLPLNKTVPVCVANPCKLDDFVPYNGICYKLNTLGGPCQEYELFSVDEITYQLHCVKPEIESFLTISVPCRAGYRADKFNRCRRIMYSKT